VIVGSGIETRAVVADTARTDASPADISQGGIIARLENIARFL
jgi:hypothetical protein